MTVMFEQLDDLTTLDDAALAEHEEAAIARFEELRAIPAPDMSDDQLVELESLSEYVTKIRDEGAARVTAAEERQARIEAAAAAIAPPTDEDDESDEDDGAEDGDEGEDGDDAEGGADDTVEVDAEEAAPAIAASGKRSPSLVATAARKTGKPKVPAANRNGGKVMITAQADIPGVKAASSLEDIAQVAKAFAARSAAFPNYEQGGDAPYPGEPGGPPKGIYTRYGVATFSRGDEAFDGHWTGNKDFEDDYAMIMDAARERNLPSGSLVASGGWCAPSETIYDLCTIESLDGLLELPEIQVRRGGIRFTTGPDFSDIYSDAGFCQTEAQAIAGTEKPCVEVECPNFEEVRLDACGICVKAPILTNAGYPELVQRWIEGTLIAQQHKMSARNLASMAAQLPAAVTVTHDLGGVGVTALGAVELIAEGLRQKWRMSRAATLEVVAPIWLLSAIRTDLSLRTGQPLQAVSDAQINSHFADRGVRVQWVYNFQPLTGDCPITYNATATLMVYPAGTFVRGVADIISLDTLYDTASLQQNMYTAAFAEEGTLVAQVCHGGCQVSFDVCLSGQTGAADITCGTTP